MYDNNDTYINRLAIWYKNRALLKYARIGFALANHSGGSTERSDAPSILICNGLAERNRIPPTKPSTVTAEGLLRYTFLTSFT